MVVALLIPAVLQMLAMAVDEGFFHRKRGLPRWERIGHPLDTLTVAAAFGWLVVRSPSPTNAMVYAGLGAFSCLFVTKDEFVHARVCAPAEGWLHAVLFVLHPLVFLAFGLLWWWGPNSVIRVQLGLTLAFGLYQVVYWTLASNRKPVPRSAVG